MKKSATNYSSTSAVESYEKQPLAHSLFVFPTLHKLLKPVRGKNILDLGCGSGVLSSQLAKDAARVIGVDTSDEWIQRAKEMYGRQPGLNFVHGNGIKMTMLKNSSMDAVVMNMVLINITSLSTIEKILSEVHRVLKTKGKLLMTVLHPISVMSKHTTLERHRHPSRFSYFQDGAQYQSTVTMRDGSIMHFDDTHWSLQSIAHALQKEGFVIEDMWEPGTRKLQYLFPDYLIIECRKAKTTVG